MSFEHCCRFATVLVFSGILFTSFGCGSSDYGAGNANLAVTGTAGQCPSGQVTCTSLIASYCTNLTTDANNCGSCGNVCSSGATCMNGSCQCPTGQVTCPAGQEGNTIFLSPYCAALATDASNCGSCGKVCSNNQQCSNSACQEIASPTTLQSTAAPGKTAPSLASGTTLTSQNGVYRLVMQTDGNLALYQSSTAIWSSNTTNIAAGGSAYMQTDGNFVVYDVNNIPRFRTNTDGNPGDKLVLQDNGDLVIYSSTNVSLWHANTATPATTCSANQTTCYNSGADVVDGLPAAYCANLATDANNCGACRNVCPSGNTCQNGPFGPSCQPPSH